MQFKTRVSVDIVFDAQDEAEFKKLSEYVSEGYAFATIDGVESTV